MPSRTRAAGGLFAAAVFFFGLLPAAQAQEETGAENEASVAVELNKVEQLDDACRAYLLFENKQDRRFEEFRLDLVLFDDEGVIARRIAVEAGPLRAQRSVVKLFDLADLQCERIDRVLLNDISPCVDEEGARENCVEEVELRTRSGVEFFR